MRIPAAGVMVAILAAGLGCVSRPRQAPPRAAEGSGRAEAKKADEAPRPVRPAAPEPPAPKAPPAQEIVSPQETTELFNGKDLAGWTLFADEAQDPSRAFRVESGVISCAGVPVGYIRTRKAYRDYLLTVEWRHLGTGGAGVIVHASGPDRIWPRGVDCDGAYGRQGDLVALGGADFEARAGRKARKGPRLPREGDSNEHPLGEWNIYEIVCRGDTISCYVNGRRMNEASRLTDSAGAIALRSDGAAWECRRVSIGPAPKGELHPSGEVELFNGKDLSGWKVFLGGADPARTFSVEGGLLKCTGQPAGYIRTEGEYENYMLRLEWRFTKPGNSGILVHMSPPDKIWPRSIECQGMSGNQGDFFVIDGTEFKEHRGSHDRRVAKRGDSNENPIGEWNVYEVVCRGDTIRPYVNGKLMNEATECNVSRGHICIQSEGAAWECRRIALLPVPADEPPGGRDRLAGPYPPAILPQTVMLGRDTRVTIRGGVEGEIRYTLDGSEPGRESPLYTQGFQLSKTTTVKARLFLPDGRSSAVASRTYRILPPEPPAPDVYISDLAPIKAVAGWGGDPKMDRSIEGNPLSVGGKSYAKGIGTHAVSEIVFALRPEYRRFVSVVGNDGEASNRGGSMSYQVFADDRMLDETPVLSGGEFWHVDVAIPAGAKTLRLVVTDGGDGIGCDHGDWANAGFVTK